MLYGLKRFGLFATMLICALIGTVVQAQVVPALWRVPAFVSADVSMPLAATVVTELKWANATAYKIDTYKMQPTHATVIGLLPDIPAPTVAAELIGTGIGNILASGRESRERSYRTTMVYN